MDAPVKAAYWLVPDQLLVGEYPGALEKEEARQKLAALLDAGVTAFIDLTPEREHGLRGYTGLLQIGALQRRRFVSHQRFPLVDGELPSEDTIRRILNAIDAAVEGGEVVYLHGHGGVKREGMVVGSYLVRRGNSPEHALEQIAQLREALPKAHRPSPETATQRSVVLDRPEGITTTAGAPDGQTRTEPAATDADQAPWFATYESRISSFALNSADVPDPEGPLSLDDAETLPPIWRFALTFPGVVWLPLDDLEWFHRGVFSAFTKRLALPDGLSLDALRALLFFEQYYEWRKGSGAHHDWERQHPMHTRFVRELVSAIRQRLVEDEWWSEQHDQHEWQRRARRLSRSGETLYVRRLAELVIEVFSELLNSGRADELLSEGALKAIDELQPPGKDPVVAFEHLLVRRIAQGLLAGTCSMDYVPPDKARAAALEEAYKLAAHFHP